MRLTGKVSNRIPAISEKAKNRWGMMIVLLAAFLPRLWFVFSALPFYVSYDEFSNISAAGLLYPLNWTEALATGSSYYGGGFSVMFALFFRVFDDPIVIYRWCLGAMAFMQAFCAVIAFSIIRRHFKKISYWLAILLSVGSTYLVVRPARSIGNEMILYFLVWLNVWLLFELVDTQPKSVKRWLLSGGLGLVFAYALTIHERMIILIPMLGFAWLLHQFVIRKSFLTLPAFALTYIPGYFLARMLKDSILAMNFPDPVNAVKNTEVTVSGVKALLDPDTWIPYLMSIFGSTVTIALTTGGVVLIAYVLFWKFGILSVFKRKALQATIAEDKAVQKLYFGTLFLGAGCFAVLLIQSVQGSWLTDMIKVMTYGHDTNQYALKILTYVRYYGIFVSPLCLFVLLYLIDLSDRKNWRLAGAAALTGALLNGYWLLVIYRYIRFSTSANMNWSIFGFGDVYSKTSGYNYYFWGSIILFGMLLLMVLLVCFRKIRIWSVLLCAFAVWQYCTLSSQAQLPMIRQKCIFTAQSLTGDSHKLSPGLDDIYVTQYSEIYQFMFYDDVVHTGLPPYDLEQGLVIVKEKSDFPEAMEHGWKIVEINSEKSVYPVFVKGEGYCRALEEQGFRLFSIQPQEILLTSEDFETTDAGNVLSKEFVSILPGTYRVTVDGLEDVSGSVKLMLRTKYSINQIIYQPMKSAVTEISVPNSCSVKVGLVGTDGVEAPASIHLERIAVTAMIGEGSPSDVTRIGKALIGKAEKPVAYLNNLSECIADFYELEQATGLTYVVRSETELLSQKEDYVLCSIESDWLRLVGPYKVKGIYRSLVLLQKQKADIESSYYLPVNKDKSITNRLKRGTYSLCFDMEESAEELQNSHRMLYGIVYSSELIDDRKNQDGFFRVLPIHLDGNKAYSELTLTANLRKWKVRIVDSWGKDVPYGEMSIKETVSQQDILFKETADKLREIIGSTGYNGNVQVWYRSRGYRPEAVKAVFRDAVGKTVPLEISIVSTDEIDFSRDGIYVFPENAKEVFDGVSRQCEILAADPGYVILYKGDNENILSLWDGTYSADRIVLPAYFSANEIPGSINLPAGSFEIMLDADTDTTGGLDLYNGGVLLRHLDPSGIKQSADGYIIRMDTLGASRLSVRTPDGVKIMERFLGVRKIPSLDSGTLVRNGDHTDETAGDSGSIVFESSGMNVQNNETYRAVVTFRGKADNAELSSWDYAYDRHFLNKTQTEIEELEDGTRRMILEVTPGFDRTNDVIVFRASFEEPFELLSLIIQKAE